MKQNILTVLGVIAILVGIVVVRSAFDQTIQTEAALEEAQEVEADLAEAAEITARAEEADAAAAETSAAATPEDAGAGDTAAEPQEPADAPDFEEIPWADETPEVYKVKFETSAGPFVIEVHRDWAPLGADRFYEMCKVGFFEDARFFRVIHGFMVQFGLAADPKMSAQFAENNLMDEPARKSNQRGKVTFAKSGMPNSRSSQIFINYGDNARLDRDGFAPFGEVIYGMENVDKITDKYGEQPQQGVIRAQGNEYLQRQFPDLDFIKNVSLVKEAA